jgi:hypothetical protein
MQRLAAGRLPPGAVWAWVLGQQQCQGRGPAQCAGCRAVATALIASPPACAARRAGVCRGGALGVVPCSAYFLAATAIDHPACPGGADVGAVDRFFQSQVAVVHIAAELCTGAAALHGAAHAVGQLGVGAKQHRAVSSGGCCRIRCAGLQLGAPAALAGGGGSCWQRPGKPSLDFGSFWPAGACRISADSYQNAKRRPELGMGRLHGCASVMGCAVVGGFRSGCPACAFLAANSARRALSFSRGSSLGRGLVQRHLGNEAAGLGGHHLAALLAPFGPAHRQACAARG